MKAVFRRSATSKRSQYMGRAVEGSRMQMASSLALKVNDLFD